VLPGVPALRALHRSARGVGNAIPAVSDLRRTPEARCPQRASEARITPNEVARGVPTRTRRRTRSEVVRAVPARIRLTSNLPHALGTARATRLSARVIRGCCEGTAAPAARGGTCYSHERAKALRFAFAVSLILAAAPAGGHEFWIRPSTFFPAAGERIAVRLFVGDRTEIDEIERRPSHMLRFEAARGGERRPVSGVAGRAPAGWESFSEPGVVVLVYQSRHSLLELPASKFERYLEEEGLDEVIAARERAGTRSALGRESYARYCKSIVRVAGGPSSGFDARVGLALELVLESNPFAWRDGDPLALRLLFQGAALGNRPVKLIHLDHPERRLAATTDAEGRVRFQPAGGGPWMAAALHMQPAGPAVEGDWQSFWASLTFALPGQVTPAMPQPDP
jgi:hypothetical protein